MLSIEPISITFSIPARDHLGRNGVVGKIRFQQDLVQVDWRLEENVFRGGKGDMQSIKLAYGQIEHVELKRRWFSYRELVIRVSDPTLVTEIPNVDMGKLELFIDGRSREEAKKLVPMIDFKRSMFIFSEQEERLAKLKSE